METGGCHVEAGEGATWRQERRGCHVEAGEGATWGQGRVPRGGWGHGRTIAAVVAARVPQRDLSKMRAIPFDAEP